MEVNRSLPIDDFRFERVVKVSKSELNRPSSGTPDGTLPDRDGPGRFATEAGAPSLRLAFRFRLQDSASHVAILLRHHHSA
jgi:hypothetical protein